MNVFLIFVFNLSKRALQFRLVEFMMYDIVGSLTLELLIHVVEDFRSGRYCPQPKGAYP